MFFVGKILSFLVSFLLFRSCSSIDTITPNQPMKDGDILVSNGGSFVLGFFSPGSSRNRYVGIWYKKVSEQTVVWVANRDDPITDFSGVLSISETGNLLLHDKKRENISVWSANVSAMTAKKASSAQLLDNGNLVLLQGSVVVWQSFDYPTDTLLPSMKLGVDRRTGLNRFLTSWKSSEDPGTGEYSYKMDPNGSPQIFLSKGSVRIWRTGPWVGLQWSGIPEKLSNFIYNTSYIDNEDEVYVVNYVHNDSVLSRSVIKQSGVIERLIWTEGSQRWIRYASAPGDKCDSYGHCGAYGNCDPYSNPNPFECTCLPGYEPKSKHDWYLRDGSKGCVRKKGEHLCGHRDGFVTVAHARVPDTLTARVNKNMGMKPCKELCLSNCSCTGYASADVNGTGNGCITWYEDLIDTRKFLGWGQDLYIRVSAVELALYSKKSKSLHRKKLVAIVVVSFTAMFLILSLVYALAMKKRKGKRRSPNFPIRRNSSLFSEGPSGSGEKEINESGTNTDLQFFDLSSVVVATENFSISNRLGEGGFGTVYKGRLDNGQEIAVKRLSKNSRQGVEELKNEVKLIAKLQHRNLVRLLGCCIHEEEKMLIYEYLPNKCLDSFIFDKEKRAMVDWRKRFEIILGITRGMIYLHQDSRLRIIHRDLKTSNVLLDATMNPKISDFGMAKIFDGDQIEANTNRVVGTYGYMAPEYAMEGLFSTKSDVYSFGVMLLEIISGSKNNSYYQDNSLNLVGHVWNLWKKSRALDVVDSSLGKSYQAHEVLRCIHIGLLCVQEFAVDRPTMSEVAFMLSHETILPPPNQPAFIFKRANNGPGESSAYMGVDSVNGVTLTAVEAR